MNSFSVVYYPNIWSPPSPTSPSLLIHCCPTLDITSCGGQDRPVFTADTHGHRLINVLIGGGGLFFKRFQNCILIKRLVLFLVGNIWFSAGQFKLRWREFFKKYFNFKFWVKCHLPVLWPSVSFLMVWPKTYLKNQLTLLSYISIQLLNELKYIILAIYYAFFLL